ncbi:DUF624 domain-containing protein [Krasilnikoviella flava]|uniref:Uncharacterized membrane protein YesL n=1 Tax=Krasilnikoviella flava TaxID=526729 RepID=A0A1T5JGH7_9MICO|nr:DUF624 domain-containing protein [Krasilnikoviella flava]SKC50707.1 Uncharacterized membrane protein YesL [Krasilnikoviella flava]
MTAPVRPDPAAATATATAEGNVRTAVAEAEVPGWAGGVMLALRWATLLVEVSVMVALGTLAGGVLLGLGPALRAGGVVTARMTAEPTPWRTFWRSWRDGFGRTTALFAPVWLVAALLWFDGVALGLLDGPARAFLQGGLLVVGAWGLVVLAFWPAVATRYSRGPAETWRFLLLLPLLGPATSVAVLVVAAATLAAAWALPLLAVLVGPGFWLWATGLLAADRLGRIDAQVAEDSPVH